MVDEDLDLRRRIVIKNAPLSPASKRKGNAPLLIAIAVVVLAALAAMLLWREPAPVTQSVEAELTDIRGRPIRFTREAQRIAIDDSRYLVALNLIHPDPVSLLSAWPQDINRLGPETYQQFLEKSPALADLPKIASSAASLDMEALLAAKPDLALLSLESGITDAQITQIEGAGIPVVIVDFFQKPFENLEKSLRILGRLTGRTEQADAFLAFRNEHMQRISSAIASLPADRRPLVFVEAHAGMTPECCNSPGRGNIGDYVDFVGGHNLGSDVIAQAFGKLNLEYVISRDPYVYIATGGPHLEKAGGLVLGAGYTPERAWESLKKVASRPGISGLSAVKAGRVHGFSHQLINSPLDIVAIEAFARWIHPDLFAAIDPQATLDAINQKFLSVPYTGTYWIDFSLPPKD